ncbi:MAG: GNAT family N-acetyltransferase, partial [Lachnospiraceae bacterium]|nr:GNAT family N-acetyltransferase [Lachnospiraceae bacterium]
MCIKKEKTLRYVLFDLKPEWSQELNVLKETLRKEGVSCTRLTEAIWKDPEELRKQMVVLTDSVETGRRLAREGIVYFGCHHRNRLSKNREVICTQQLAQKERDQGKLSQNTFYDTVPYERIRERKPDSDTVWFDGAALVLEGFGEVDAKYLEEWMLRARGLPAEIARTDRLVIREMTEEDLPDLVRIGRQDEGAGLGLRPDVFTEEGLQAYIQNAYRLQGFGLWSVLYEGDVIGCCGFEPCAGQDIYTHRMILNLEEEGQLCEREAGKYQREEGQLCEREAGKYQKEEGQLCEREAGKYQKEEG